MFRNLSLKYRLTFSAMISIGAVLILVLLSLYSLWQSELELERQIKATEAIKHELSIDADIRAIEASAVYAVLRGSDASEELRKQLQDRFAKDVEHLRTSRAALREMNMSPRIGTLITNLDAPTSAFLMTAEQVMKSAFTDPTAARILLATLKERYDSIDRTLKLLGTAIADMAAETALTARAHDMRMLYTLLAFSSAVIVLMLFNLRSITLTATRPIARLRLALRDVVEGDFGLKIEDRMRPDEFGEIASDIDKLSERVVMALEEQRILRDEGEQVIERLREGLQRLAAGDLGDRIDEEMSGDYDALRLNYNETVDKLNELMSQVVSSSNRIQEQSGEIQSASEDLSHRTESQAATLEETAAALEMMTSSVSSAAQNAKEVAASVEDTRHEVQNCGKVVEEAVVAMTEIEASSSQISQIIGVIDGIAFQTNLLALNAGVEAARAGDVGRGFAVVASEVRALAQRTSDAANEIKALIEDSSRHVEGGVEKVNQAGDALSTVVGKVTQISELISNISSEATEQAQGLSEVNVGVSQLDQATQQNVSMVESSSAAIRVLNNETVGLNDLVGQFSLGNDVEQTVVNPKFEESVFFEEQQAARIAS